MPENEAAVSMRFIGLLTHEQKQAGYFVSQDEDFVYVWQAQESDPRMVATFLYETATIQEVRNCAAWDAALNPVATVFKRPVQDIIGVECQLCHEETFRVMKEDDSQMGQDNGDSETFPHTDTPDNTTIIHHNRTELG